MNKLILLLLICLNMIFLTGCPVGNTVYNGENTTSTTSGKSGKAKTSQIGPTFTIINAITNQTSTSGSTSTTTSTTNSVPSISVVFNATNLSETLNDFCQVQSQGSGNSNSDTSRSCKCRFKWDENNLSDSSVIPRTVDTNPTQITSFQVQCPAPNVYNTEIADQTLIKLSVVPDTSQGNNSGFQTNEYSYKKTSTTSTSDFRDSEGRGYKNIYHYVCFDKAQKKLSIEHAQKQPAGDQNNGISLLVPIANDFTTGSDSVSSYSAQSYYYDFYIRDNEPGSINSGNESFTCPQVTVEGSSSYFPMDSTFALALNSSKDFPIQISSNIAISVSATNTSGDILGFAAKPNPDGTCPVFQTENNTIRYTYRLRKYRAIYPLRFKATGDQLDTSQPINTVYVIDRPVGKAGQDSSKPITRLGPKPCPFSFKTAQFGQKCSSDATLNGWNIDGTQVNGNPACPVYPPPPDKYLKSDGTLVIRPFKPFISHFLEDTSFKACAFQSSQAVDPEIVVYHNDNAFPLPEGPSDFYCAKHYPAAGAILPPPNGDPFDKPPGECSESDTASAIKTMKSADGYSCALTYNPTNSSSKTPSAGCCQVCAGTDCSSVGGGTTAAGRNAAFSPPQDSGNPTESSKTLPRTTWSSSTSGGCFDPRED